MSRHARLAELSLSFSETAFLLWETQCPNYEFAECFNRLYDLSLARETDLQLPDDARCPFFLHYDDRHALLYVFVDNPLRGLDADFARYDKIMLINGRDAFEQQRRIYDDYATHTFPPPASDLLQWHRYELLQEARRDVFSVQYFDYRRSDEARQRESEELAIVRHNAEPQHVPQRHRDVPIPESSLLTGMRKEPNAKMRKALNNIYQLFEDILHALENPVYADPEPE
ncbi:MAG: hypothetical protein AUK63_474 [bacterium P3]|nr:MAG: hypothetical protein AUK63_474 [bacterium P3]KWW41930.1 MAG: hypothetical protein F083_581 [bacterium F083]